MLSSRPAATRGRWQRRRGSARRWGWIPPPPPQRRRAGGAPIVALVVIVVLAAVGGGIGIGFALRGSGPSRPAVAKSKTSSSTLAASKVDPGLVDVNTTLGYEDEAAGTGMMLSSSGTVLSNNHVVDGATAIRSPMSATTRRTQRAWSDTTSPRTSPFCGCAVHLAWPQSRSATRRQSGWARR